MLNTRHLFALVATVTALLLTAAACGSDSEPGLTTGEVPTTEDSGGLPLADDGADTPVVSGVCAPGEPDCEDTAVSNSDSESSSGMTVGDGLSIPEALATDATGMIAVHGHLFDDGGGLQLCEKLVSLGERYGCDAAHISVADLDLTTVSDIVLLEGTSYTEDELTLFGELVDGTLTVDSLVTG
jgi:hypothetical protein